MQNRSPFRNNPSHPSIGGVADTGERAVDQLLDGTDLLRVLREPVEWLLALAYQLADGDPVDIAAIVRLRAAFHAWLSGRTIGIRKTDLLVVFGILAGALDPNVVFRAVSDPIGDELTAMVESESSLALHLTSNVDPIRSLLELIAALQPQRASRLRCTCSVCSHLGR